MPLDLDTEVRLHLENERRWPEIAPHSCNHCQKMTLDLRTNAAVPHEILYGTADAVSRPREAHRPGHSLRLLDLINGSVEGCPFFDAVVKRDQILSALLSKMEGVLPRADLNVSLKNAFESCRGARIAGQKTFEYCARDLIYLTALTGGRAGNRRSQKVRWVILWQRSDISTRYETMCRWEVYSVPGAYQPTAIESSLFPPNLAPASPLSFLRANDWLHVCESQHSRCLGHQTRHAPTRLLEIDAEMERVRLVTSAKITKYAALSYCWGGDQPAKSTIGRLEAYGHFFPIELLPATISDAVLVAFNLGFRHIWIDALCIVQDDEVDVLREVGEMHKIFRGAAVTIAACDAAASTAGFLQTRTRFRPTILHARDDMVSSFPLLAIRDDFARERALYNRAWVLQEMHLSSRVLLFEERQVSFVCMEAECAVGASVDQAARSPFMDPGSKSLTAVSHPRAWMNVVETFSRLDLSVSMDKLPALGAMAEDYALKRKLTGYYAGMWREDFVVQLLWQVLSPCTSDTQHDAYSGPSWSWCSILHDPVNYVAALAPEITYTAAMKDVHVELLSPNNQYGRVTSARTTLTGKIYSLLWPDAAADAKPAAVPFPVDPDTSELSGVTQCSYDPALTYSFLLRIYNDRQEMWPEGTPLCIIEIARYERFVYGLALRPVEGEPLLYQRVGVVECTPAWFDSQTVTEADIVIV